MENISNINNRQTSIPLLYYIVTLAGGITLAFITGRIVVDPASYGIPDFPKNIPSIIILIVYELLILPWLFKTNKIYAIIRTPLIPALISALIIPYSIELHIVILLLGSITLLIETKILLDIAAAQRKVLYSLAGIFRGLAGFMALVYSISLMIPSLRNSIITITQLILALLPFIILGAYMGLILHLLTMTRDPLKLAGILAPLTIATVILTIITYIYTQPALTNPNQTLQTYGNITRTINTITPILTLTENIFQK